MILLDTNVVSELMKPTGTRMEEWLTNTPDATLTISSVTVAEIAYGLHLLPDGRRRQHLEDGWRSVQEVWRGDILPVTEGIAELSGVLMAEQRMRGRTLDLADALIASTALVHEATLATRNTKDFEGLGIELVDPWDPS